MFLRILPILSLVFLGYLFSSFPTVFGGQFEQAYVRFERNQINATTGGLVCATPETGGTENKVVVTLPSNFGVNSTAGNWTVNTSNLPSGATAWPGIGTASSVSGKTVTFPSNDLSTGVQYCFNFSGTNTVTNPSVIDNDIGGVIETQNSGSSVIDTVNFYPLTTNFDQVEVTAIVPANTTAYTTTTTLLNSGSVFSQGTTLNYEINYGTTSQIDQPIVLQASWTQGTIQSTGSVIDILSYVVGSASDGYASVEPVIDTVNRTITWTIPSFPAELSNQKVSFSLYINDYYTGSSQVQFSVTSNIEVGGEFTADSSVTSYYQYSQPSPGPAASSAPGSPSPSSSPAQQSQLPTADLLRILEVKLRQIKNDSAEIEVRLNQEANLKIVYGTDPNRLNSELTSLSIDDYHLIELLDLESNRQYYFRLQITDRSGRRIRSELFTFKTAKEGGLPRAEISQMILLSGTSLFDYMTPGFLADGIYSFVIPKGSEFEFRVPFLKFENINRVTASLELDNNVLGATNPENKSDISEVSTSMIEIYPGVYAGKLKSPMLTQRYELILTIEDYNGAIIRQPLSGVRVVNPLTILDESGRGIEGGMVKVEFFNERSKVYEELSARGIGIKNPIYSGPGGEVELILPKGKYRAVVMALGYERAQVEFEISPDSEINYPTINLKAESFNLLTFFKYYWESFSVLIDKVSEVLGQFLKSQRMFNLASFMAVLLLIILSVITFSFRIRTPIWRFREFIKHLWFLATGKDITGTVSGVVKADGKYVGGVEITLIDGHDNVLNQTLTNKTGKFFFGASSNATRIMAIKRGYEVATHDLNDTAFIELQLGKLSAGEEIIKESGVAIKNFAGFSFEVVLLISLITEIFFGFEFGFLKAAPFILITLINFGLWFKFVQGGWRVKEG